MEYTLKKSLGQHFLKDEKICLSIVDAIPNCERLVEVGPGAGAITKYILQTFCSITVTYYNVNHICNIFVIFVDPDFTKWHLPHQNI